MIGFIGEYESTIDAKGRFLLPSGFKKQLPEQESYVFVINRGFEKCLTLYPIQSWEPIFKEISQLNDFDPKVRAFRRNFSTAPSNLNWILQAGFFYLRIYWNMLLLIKISYWYRH
jgi:division/cell wall cluster transcriptional repressor MraZ